MGCESLQNLSRRDFAETDLRIVLSLGMFFLPTLGAEVNPDECLGFYDWKPRYFISPALQPNSKRTICDWQRLGPAAWISDRVLPTWFPESINRPHIRAGVLKISRGTDNVKSGCTHRQSTRKRTCANLLTIVPTVIAAQ